MKTKFTAIVLALLLVLSVAAGCTQTPQSSAPSEGSAEGASAENSGEPSDSSSDDTETVSLRVRNWMPEMEVDFKNYVNPEFKKLHPNVEIVFDYKPDDQYYTVLKTEIQAGEAPDLFSTHGTKTNDFGQFVSAGACEDLTGMIDESIFNPILVNICKIDEKLYSTPAQFFQPEFVFYNKAVFSQYELSEPQTLAELEAICDKLIENGVTPFALPGKSAWGQFWFINCLVTSFAPDWVEEFTAGTAKTDDQRIKDAFALYQTYIDKGYFGKDYMSMDDNGVLPLFSAGKAAMVVNGGWAMSAYMELEGVEIGIFTLPGKDKPYLLSSPHPVNGYCVYTESKDGDMALELAKFIATKEMCQYSAENSQIGNLPGVEGVSTPNADLQKLLDTSVIVDQYVNYYQFRAMEGFDAMNDYVSGTQEILFGQTTIDELAAKVDAEIE